MSNKRVHLHFKVDLRPESRHPCGYQKKSAPHSYGWGVTREAVKTVGCMFARIYPQIITFW